MRVRGQICGFFLASAYPIVCFLTSSWVVNFLHVLIAWISYWATQDIHLIWAVMSMFHMRPFFGNYCDLHGWRVTKQWPRASIGHSDSSKYISAAALRGLASQTAIGEICCSSIYSNCFLIDDCYTFKRWVLCPSYFSLPPSSNPITHCNIYHYPSSKYQTTARYHR